MAFRVGSAPSLSPLADLPSLSGRRIWYPGTHITPDRGQSEVASWPCVFHSQVPAGLWRDADRLVQEARNVREEVG